VLGCSDSFVGVQHDSKGSADGSWWQVFCEFSADEPIIAMACNDSSPQCLVAFVFLHVFGFKDEGDTLSVVEGGCFTIIAVLDLEDCVLLGLSGLSTSEIHKCCFLVQSNSIRRR